MTRNCVFTASNSSIGWSLRANMMKVERRHLVCTSIPSPPVAYSLRTVMSSSGKSSNGAKGNIAPATALQNGYHHKLRAASGTNCSERTAAVESPCACPAAAARKRRRRTAGSDDDLCNNTDSSGIGKDIVPSDSNCAGSTLSANHDVQCNDDVGIVIVHTALNEACDQVSVSGSSDCSSLPIKDDEIVGVGGLLSSGLAAGEEEDEEEDGKNDIGSTPADGIGDGAGGPADEKFTRCEWNKCGQNVETDVLLEHIRMSHVMSQVKPAVGGSGGTADKAEATTAADEPSFVCLWEGCKVYNRPSCLLAWLDRHVVCHLGDKPHRCIVAGCGARFASQPVLERHVNAHFSGTCSASALSSAMRPPRKGDTGGKSSKKRRLRSVRLCPVRSEDYFDSKVMDLIQKQFVTYANSSQVEMSVSGNLIPFHCSVIAKRTAVDGRTEVLIHWTPSNVLPDEWLSESDVSSLTTTRSLPLSCLPNDLIYELFTLPRPSMDGFHRHRRK